ncbi:MAG: ferredoxin--NADP(+) reductase [Chloroflexi bacterium]|nr:ferredoxin--NADP(+) reductase [Chloroflexota bacterium]
MTTRKIPKKPPLAEVSIIDRQDQTEDLTLMWIEKPEGYQFKPGQYCTIGHDGVERAYSIASSPHEKYIELFIELVPLNEGGVLTPILWGLDKGDKVTIRPRAKGIFTFKEEKSHQLLVSTVTGIVPYVSFIRNYLESGRSGHKFYILAGASYSDEFIYDKEFIELSEKYPEFIKFIPSVSRPDEEKNSGWSGSTGRVNNIIEDKISELQLPSDDTMVYACGNPDMIEDVKKRVTPLGFGFLEERFWKDD